MVSCESASSSQGCTLNMAMLVGIAITAWIVREGAIVWWGISPLGRVPGNTAITECKSQNLL